MDAVEIEKAIEQRRIWLGRHLAEAAQQLNVTPRGPVVKTYDLRSAGVRALDDDHGEVWLRVVFEDPDYQPACRWDGNVEANTINGVPKPQVLRCADWHNQDDYRQGCRLRGEVMTLAPGTTITSDSVLDRDPNLPDSWWANLQQALAALAAHPVPATDPVNTLRFTTNGVRKHFDVRLNEDTFTGLTWTTAHADLHWGNLTGPQLCILDWECWRRAPAGYDAATLYCNSLPHPPTAQRIRRLFEPVLDTHSGHIALLFALCRYLNITEDGDEYEALAAPLRNLGAQVLDRLS
ncbi:MAG: hypothetical protein ACRDSP_17525 [Pseudonocardiaceae bacterium]